MQPLITTDITLASEALVAGNLVGMPTETVYGLAARADDDAMVQRIFATKHRPNSSPLIVHVASVDMAREWVACMSDEAELLASRFWPGPLTLILRSSGRAATTTLAGGSTIGLRVPDHPMARKLIDQVGTGLAAPSANRHTKVSPTTASHVASNFTRDEVSVVLDGGSCHVGIESAIIDLTGASARVLRSGSIGISTIMEAIDAPIEDGIVRLDPRQASLVSTPAPGQSRVHYAPAARVVLVSSLEDLILRVQLEGTAGHVGVIAPCSPTRIEPAVGDAHILLATADPNEFARGLYAAFHEADTARLDVIIACAPLEGSAAAGIHDRLSRAAAASE